MTTLAERRKDAIKVHDTRTKTIIRELDELVKAMRQLGLKEGADRLEQISGSIQFDMKRLLVNASVNSAS